MIDLLVFIITLAAIGASIGLLAFCLWSIATGFIEFIIFLFDVFCDDNEPEGTL